MRFKFNTTCQLLLFFGFIGIRASPIVPGEDNESTILNTRDDTGSLVSHAFRPSIGWGGYQGGGIGGGWGLGTTFNKNSPPCIVHFGDGSIDSVRRTNSLFVLERSTDSKTFHSWGGTLSHGMKLADVYVKTNLERKLEISVENSDGITLPDIFDVTMHAVSKVTNPPIVKYYLDTKKGLKCIIDTGHTPGFWYSVDLRY